MPTIASVQPCAPSRSITASIFNQQLAGIKPVDAPSPSVQLFHAVFEADRALAGEAEDVAQPAYEVLRLAHLVAGIGKLFGKLVGAAEDFSPVGCDSHGIAWRVRQLGK